MLSSYLVSCLVLGQTNHIESLVWSCDLARARVALTPRDSFLDQASSELTTRRQRSITVPFPDDPQSRRGCDGCVVCLYDPRFVPVHTNRGIVTHPEPGAPVIRVYRETTIMCEVCVESDEDCLDGHPCSFFKDGPSLISVYSHVRVEADTCTVIQ